MIAYRLLPGPKAGTVRVERTDGTLISPCMNAEHAAARFGTKPATTQAPKVQPMASKRDISRDQFVAELKKLVGIPTTKPARPAAKVDAAKARLAQRAGILAYWTDPGTRAAMAKLSDAELSTAFLALLEQRAELNAKMGLPTPGEEASPLSAARALELARGGKP